MTAKALSSIIPQPQLAMIDGKVMACSTEIADTFGKQHHNVIKAIEKLEIPKERHRVNFNAISYRDAYGRYQKAYNLTRDGFTLLAMGFTGKTAMRFKLAYIDAFNEMERRLRGGVPAGGLQQAMAQLELAMQDCKRVYRYPSGRPIYADLMESDPAAVDVNMLYNCWALYKLLMEMAQDGHDVAGPVAELQEISSILVRVYLWRKRAGDAAGELELMAKRLRAMP